MSEREFLKEKDLLLNSIEKNTAKHWENYYSNVPIKCIFEDLVIDINEIKRLTEENQELKQKYLNAVADYETTMFEKEQLNSLVNSCQEEIRRLKKQLEEYKLITIDYQELEARNKDLENQQKEFILYLENEIYSIEPKGTGINYNCEYDSEEDYISAMKEQSKLNTLKEILSKYKEIIERVRWIYNERNI